MQEEREYLFFIGGFIQSGSKKVFCMAALEGLPFISQDGDQLTHLLTERCSLYRLDIKSRMATLSAFQPNSKKEPLPEVRLSYEEMTLLLEKGLDIS